MPAEINAVLQQQGRTGPVKEIQIINGREVRVITGVNTKQKVFLVSLLALADKSHVRLNIAKNWLILFGVSALALLIYWLLKSVLGHSLGDYEFSFVTVLAICCLLGLVLFGLNLSRKRVYYSRHAGVALFDMLIGYPDSQAYKTFHNCLEDYIKQARESWGLKLEQQIAGEIKMLRRLASEGVISQGDYEQAKDQLFSLTSKNSR